MVQILSERYRWHIRYKCPACEWSGIVALGFPLTDQELVQWFSCPVHGEDPNCRTKLYRMDRDGTRERQRGR